MTTWVFNNGSSNHRGVWHAATAPIVYNTVEAKTREIVRDVFAYHKKDCAWHEFEQTTYNYWGQPKQCTCGLGTQKYSVVIGKVTMVYHDPEHLSTGPIRTMCNQVTLYGARQPITYTGKFDFGPDDLGKSFDIEGHVGEFNPDDLYAFEGNLPPGPVCSRCKKKAAALD